MFPEWAHSKEGQTKRGASTAWRLGVVASATVLSGAAAALAVSLVPPVHRARIELVAEGGPLPSWTAADVQELADRRPATAAPTPTASGPDPLTDLLNQPRSHMDGTASRRTGIEALSPTRSVLWAEAGSPDVAAARVRFIADQLLSRAPKPARQLDEPAAPSSPPVAATPVEARLAEAREHLAEAERQLAAFDAQVTPASAVVSQAPPALPAGDHRAALESRRGEIEAAIAAVEGGDERFPMPGTLGAWDTWRALMRERRGLEPRAAELTANLSDAHPRVRIVRLRLEQLEGEIAQRRDTLLTDLQAQRSANDAAIEALTRPAAEPAAPPAENAQTEESAGRAALVAARDAAREEVSRLEAELAAPSALATPSSDPAQASPAPLIRQRALPISVRSLSLWPAALAGGVVGFLGSAFFVALSVPLRRKEAATPGEPATALVETPPPDRPGRPEIAMVDDVIEALKFSAVARVVVVSAASAESRPLGVDIGRRLALRGRSVLVVDLSQTQDAARAMGLPAGTPGLFDLVRGDVNFAEIARRDFATGAEIVACGRTLEDEDRASLWSERRHAIDFMERSYETLVIDCGRIGAPSLKAVLDPEAALLLWVDGCSDSEVEAALDQLKGEGVADMIVVRDRRAN